MNSPPKKEIALELVLLRMVADTALRNVRERTLGSERELRTALRDLDGYRRGKFIPFGGYNPALSERGVILSGEAVRECLERKAEGRSEPWPARGSHTRS